MQFFDGLSQESEIKQAYKELAKKYHPDLGGDVETMKIINAQYEQVLKGAYQKEGKSLSEVEELLKEDKKACEALKAILGLYGLTVELCGKWIWVTGSTKEVKDILKEANFKWARKKMAWYWRPSEQKFKRYGKTLDLNQIRDKYGSNSFSNKKKSIA